MAPWSIFNTEGPPFDFENVEVVIDEIEEHLVNTWRSEEGTFAKGGQEERDRGKEFSPKAK